MDKDEDKNDLPPASSIPANLVEDVMSKEAALAAQHAAAAAKQAMILEKRHAEDSKYAYLRETVVAAWNASEVKLSECPVHAGPITSGQSVLLQNCLHAICRSCALQIIQVYNSVRCPVCSVDSPVKIDALPLHPFIEAELAAGEAHDCAMCLTVPDEDRMPAALKCENCVPQKLLCEGHAMIHRKNPKTATHTIRPLPHGGTALRCPTHDEPFAAYCTVCRELVCYPCTLSTHGVATHPVRLLSDTAFFESVRARLVEGVALARALADALIDHATDAMVAVDEVDERDAAIASDIDRTFSILVGMLERRREAVHSERLARSREERAALQRMREESSYHWRIVTSAANLAEQLANGTHLGVNATAVMVQLEAVATKRLHAVLELAPERGVPPPAILLFHLDESLAKRLSTLGEIIQESP